MQSILRSVALLGAPGLATSLALIGGAAQADTLKASEPEPVGIFNGVDTTECMFPSAVGILDRASGELFCTGTLIHPQVVLFAAHCIDPDGSWATAGTIIFGEDVASPVRPIPVTDCVIHPQWKSAGIDLAACTLPVAVRHVPIVPLLAGCEVDALQPGTVVTIVGFGATAGFENPEGDITSKGVGHKRFTQQTITDVSPRFNDIVMVGPGTGACFGDSGGPAFVQLADGTWRVFGAASTLHPEHVPDEEGEVCGLGTVYEIAYNHVDWLESFSGFDLTPCHDVDGTWNPGPDCRGFPLSPAVPESTWRSGCEVQNVGTWSRTCGPAFNETPAPIPPSPPGPEPEPVPVPLPDGEPLEDTDTAGEDDGPDRGCKCNGSAGAPPALALLALLALRRRRA